MCVLDENGKKVFDREIKGTADKVIEEMAKVKAEKGVELAVCFEASCGCGYLHDGLRKVAKQVKVAHPGHLHLIYRSKKKNDRVDAGKLAKLLFVDALPTVHVPAADVRSWRGLIEQRGRLVEKRTGVKNEIRALLRGQGLLFKKNIWTKAGRAELWKLEIADAVVSFRLTMLLNELEYVMSQVRAAEKVLDSIGRRHPGVALLCTIPGIGRRTAECLVAYIDDPRRFDSTSQVAAYFGLVPCLDSSAGQDRFGHITKQGPATARKLLTEASWLAIRRSETVKSYYERVRRGDPDRKKIALVATAHYLLRVSLALLKTGECWMEASEREAA
jgi:transposase